MITFMCNIVTCMHVVYALHVLCSVLCCCFVFCLLLLAHSPMSSVIGHQRCTPGSNRSSVPCHTCSRSPINRFPLKALCFLWVLEDWCCFELWQSSGTSGICFPQLVYVCLAFCLYHLLWFRGLLVSCLQFLLFLFILLSAPGQTRIGKIPRGLHFTPT